MQTVTKPKRQRLILAAIVAVGIITQITIAIIAARPQAPEVLNANPATIGTSPNHTTILTAFDCDACTELLGSPEFTTWLTEVDAGERTLTILPVVTGGRVASVKAMTFYCVNAMESTSKLREVLLALSAPEWVGGDVVGEWVDAQNFSECITGSPYPDVAASLMQRLMITELPAVIRSRETLVGGSLE